VIEMSVESIDLAELNRRSGRPERWAPAVLSSPLTLRVAGGGFGDASYSWAAIQTPGAKEGVVREAMVKREAFLRLMKRPGTVEELMRDGLVRVKDLSISPDVVTQIVTAGAGFLIPVVASLRNMVVDGFRYSLSLSAGDCSVELGWAQQGPEEWHALTAWARSTRRTLHEMVCPGEPLPEPPNE
jgi:hypothetical protein